MTMRKILLIPIFTAMLMPRQSFACDQCGCSVSGAYGGLMAFNTDNFIGLRFATYSFSGNIEATGPVSSHFHSLDLIGAFKIHEHWQLMAYVPYKMIDYTSADIDLNKKGIGDAGILNTITLMSNTDDPMRKHTYVFAVKAGVELPTGQFNPTFRADHTPGSVSTGSGSVDLMSGLQFRYQKDALSFFADYSYKYNLTNSRHYQFGDQHALSMVISEKSTLKKYTLSPYTGFTAESIHTDTYYDLMQPGTAGNLIYVNTGFELGIKTWRAGLNYDIPVYSRFNSGSPVKSESRLALRVNYAF